MSGVPVWVKWVSIIVILITSLIIPLVFFEDESNRLAVDIINWSQDQPLVASLVLILALAADVFLPVPNGVINTVAGSMFGWGIGAAVIWLGLSLGCVTGYAVGRYAASPIVRRFVGADDLEEAAGLAQRIGAPALVITRTVPMFAEVITIAAGITEYPFKKFMLLTSLANVGVAVVFAGIGDAASEMQSGLLAFAGAVALPLLAWLGYRFVYLRREDVS